MANKMKPIYFFASFLIENKIEFHPKTIHFSLFICCQLSTAYPYLSKDNLKYWIFHSTKEQNEGKKSESSTVREALSLQLFITITLSPTFSFPFCFFFRLKFSTIFPKQNIHRIAMVVCRKQTVL